MRNKEVYNIKLTGNTKVIFPNNKPGNILLCGFIEGMFGEKDDVYGLFGYCDEVAENNVQLLIDAIKSNNQIRILGTDSVIKYVNDTVKDFVKSGVFTEKQVKSCVKYCTCGTPDAESYGDAMAKAMNRIYNFAKETEMKFDYIIQNPPYKGSLHLDFLEKGLDLLTENGKMVIIEPAMWLINLNPNSTYVKGTKTNHTPKIKEII